MSADNYFVIRRHPQGGYAAVMGFDSDPGDPGAHDTDPHFTTLDEALTWALDQYSEYGVSVHPECDTAADDTAAGENIPHDSNDDEGADTPHYTEPGQWAFSNTPTYPHDAEWATLGLHVLADAVADHYGTPIEPDGYRPLLTSKLSDGTPEHRSVTFTLRAYCWCDGDTPGHENGCPPNFIYHPTGLTITWYKHAGRGVTSNQKRPGNWTQILATCIQSLHRP